MIQKTYQATSLSEAIDTVKKEMGSRAVIISTKKLNPKKLFFLKNQPAVEVTAGVKENDISPDQLEALQESLGIKPRLAKNSSKQNTSQSVQVQISSDTENRLLKDKVRQLEKEIAQLREEQFSAAIAEQEENHPIEIQAEQTAGGRYIPIDGNTIAFEEKIAFLTDYLQDNEICQELIDDWQKTIRMLPKNTDPEEVLDESASFFLNLIPSYTKNLPQTISFFGPDGNGKTSTVFKMAHYLKRQNKKVAIVILDSKKRSLAEQMSMYPEEMSIPFFVVHQMNNYEQLLKNNSDFDHFLIDTQISFNQDESLIETISDKLEQLGALNLAVLSACDKDSQKMIEAQTKLKIKGLIITKVDELFHVGSLFNFIYRIKKPILYYGVGQNMNEDFEIATAERLVSLLYRINQDEESAPVEMSPFN